MPAFSSTSVLLTPPRKLANPLRLRLVLSIFGVSTISLLRYEFQTPPIAIVPSVTSDDQHEQGLELELEQAADDQVHITFSAIIACAEKPIAE